MAVHNGVHRKLIVKTQLFRLLKHKIPLIKSRESQVNWFMKRDFCGKYAWLKENIDLPVFALASFDEDPVFCLHRIVVRRLDLDGNYVGTDPNSI